MKSLLITIDLHFLEDGLRTAETAHKSLPKSRRRPTKKVWHARIGSRSFIDIHCRSQFYSTRWKVGRLHLKFYQRGCQRGRIILLSTISSEHDNLAPLQICLTVLLERKNFFGMSNGDSPHPMSH